MRVKYLMILSIASLALPVGVFAATAKPHFYYAAWLPFWKTQSGQQDVAINLDSLDEISPFSYEIGAHGAIIDDLDINNGTWPGWLDAVHDAGTKVIPTIAWFDGPAIHSLLSVAKTRQAEEDTITALAKTQGFDGIDIDFESKLPQTKPYFSLFIQGLAMRLHPLKKTVSCTIEARTPLSSLYEVIPDDIQYSNDFVALNKYCDEVRVMAYDQGTIDIQLDATKGNGTLYAPTADPAWVEKVIKETIKTIAPRKVMIGIPTYGYEYEASWALGATTYRRVRSFTFTQAMDRADSLGIEPTRNNAGELSFTFASTTFLEVSPALFSIVQSTQPAALANPNPLATTTFYVSFSDAQSSLDKINLAKKYGLRGAAFFKADGEMDPGTWDIMK